MAEYYLISQLPSLDGLSDDKPLPITEERFLELCGHFLGKKAECRLKKLSLLPPMEYEKSNSALIEEWNAGERNLRLALAKVRAEKMKKPFNLSNTILSAELIKIATAAIEIENPLNAEKFLNFHRLSFLETLRPMDNFSQEFIYYYGLKLKLLLYMRQFNADVGEAAYKNIYNSILDGDRLEAI